MAERTIDPTEADAKELVLLIALLVLVVALAGLPASAVSDTGASIFNIQYLLAHSESEMVRRYAAVLGMEDALEAHEKASPVDMMGPR